MIKPVSIYAYNLESISIEKEQLLYCRDTSEAYFDISETNRIQIGCTIQLDTEYEKNTLSHIQNNKIYIVRETNKLYRHLNGQFINITDRVSVMDLIVPIEKLIPVTLNKQGINYAPKTLATSVYTNDGNNVEDVLKGMVNDDRKVLLYTRTEHVVATIEGQRVFGIPFPIPNYDLAKFPMLVIYKERILPPGDYAISNEQVILSHRLDGLAKDEILTFVFHYNVVLANDNLNAESINNVRFFVSDKEPYNKIETDVWFDTKKLEVKQYMGGKWKIIVKSNMNDDYPYFVEKNTTILKDSTTHAEIGVLNFNPEKDILMVYENSVYLEEHEDYTISADGRYITNISENLWIGTEEEPVILNFVIFKALNTDKAAPIIKKSSIITDNVFEIGLSNFDKYKDTLFVYENSVYLEEGEDYVISADSSRITKTNGQWQGEYEELYMNFVIFKNSKKRLDDEDALKKSDNIIKTQVLAALGISESQFTRLKQML